MSSYTNSKQGNARGKRILKNIQHKYALEYALEENHKEEVVFIYSLRHSNLSFSVWCFFSFIRCFFGLGR